MELRRHHAQAGPTHRLSASQCIRAARGFSCLFWGIPLGMLLFSSQAIGIRGAISVIPLAGLKLPPFVVALLLMYAGTLYLFRAQHLTNSWNRNVRWTLFVIFLQLYFSPFFHWWDRMPHQPHFLLNMLGLLASTIVALYLLNQLTGLAGLALDDDTLYIETKFCGWAVIALMAFPLTAAFIYSFVAVLRYDSSFYSELLNVIRELPVWVLALFMLPFLLTMGSLWKAKERCMRELRYIELSKEKQANEHHPHPPQPVEPELQTAQSE